MKNTFKIKGSMLFWCTAFLTVLTGTFHSFFLFMSLILVHECGHAFLAYLFHWNIKKIMLYPFGGITFFEEKINRPMKEELLILLAGPIFQIGYYEIYKCFFSVPEFFSFSHRVLLSFNLLPIYPLDGGRIFFLFYQTILSYRHSHKVMLFTSFLFLLFLLLLVKPSFFLLLFVLCLLFQLWEEKKREPFLFFKFLWERIFYSFSFPYEKLLPKEKVGSMKRDTYHFFQDGKVVLKEEDFLRKMFDL